MTVKKTPAAKHDLKNSGLYRIPTMSSLARILHWKKAPSALRALCKNNDNWNEFELKREGKEPRLIQEPKPSAKALQLRLNDLLKRINPPGYLHSGTPGRSYLSNSAEHMGQAGATVTVDIAKFYPSVSRKRVYKLFRVLFECESDIADALADLMCCNGHLATGSPASALVSFWACKDMFDGVARRAEKMRGQFTLYVDDITLTAATAGHGDVRFLQRYFANFGFSISTEKSRVYTASAPKHVTGRVMRKGASRAPNKQHLKMHESTKIISSGNASLHEKRSAIGKIQHVALLDAMLKPKLTEHARRIRETMSE